jgi:diamine N-acetyltransferase
MESIRIVRGGPADAEAIADLSRAAFHAAFAKDNTPENMRLFMEGPYARERLMEEVRAGETEFFLARDGQRLLGYATLRAGAALLELAGAPAREWAGCIPVPPRKAWGLAAS